MKKLQVIVSTHSEYFIDSVPQISRVLVQRASTEHIINKAPTTRSAMGIMTGRANPELNVYCEDYFAELLIRQSLSNDSRSRTHVVPVGSNSELINQTVFHLRAGFGQHTLILWDGDSETRIKAKNWLKRVRDVLISKGDANFFNTFKNRVNWGFLPGSDAPELWAIKILNNADGFSILKSQLNCSSDSEAEVIIGELASVSEPHNIGYELSKKFSLEEEEAQRILIKSVYELPSKPLDPINQKISSILNNKRIKQKFSDLA